MIDGVPARILAGDAIWSPAAGYVPQGAAVLDAAGLALALGTLPELRRRAPELPVDEGPGLVLPGLVDAHAHLELGALAGRVPGGGGLSAWVGRLLKARAGLTESDMRAGAFAAARAMRACGTTAVADTATLLATAPLLREVGLAGVAHLEVVGASESAAAAALEDARRREAEAPGDPRVAVRATPHSVYGTAPGAIRALAGAKGVPSIHASEHADEDAWLLSGEGPFAPFLRERGAEPPGMRAVPALEELEALGPRSLLVHLVTAEPSHLDVIRRAGATAVLCPRSNLHIGGKLADLPAMCEAGVALALGTDSLASTPDHDLLGEVRTLAAHFPQVPVAVLLHAATAGGARALGLPEQPWVRARSENAAWLLERLS